MPPESRKTAKYPRTLHIVLYIILYTLLMMVMLVVIHEGAHVLMAITLGVPFNELEFGFFGVNPTIRLPEWLDEGKKTLIFYAGGLATGAVFLVLYACYWFRKYRRHPNLFSWAAGAATIMFSVVEFATGYLEGRYHAAYIRSATMLLSPTNILTYFAATWAFLLHSLVCPPRLMRRKHTDAA